MNQWFNQRVAKNATLFLVKDRTWTEHEQKWWKTPPLRNVAKIGYVRAEIIQLVDANGIFYIVRPATFYNHKPSS